MRIAFLGIPYERKYAGRMEQIRASPSAVSESGYSSVLGHELHQVPSTLRGRQAPKSCFLSVIVESYESLLLFRSSETLTAEQSTRGKVALGRLPTVAAATH